MRKILKNKKIYWTVLLCLLLLPAGAFAESVTFDYGRDKSYNNGQLLWDGDKLILDVYPGGMPLI